MSQSHHEAIRSDIHAMDSHLTGFSVESESPVLTGEVGEECNYRRGADHASLRIATSLLSPQTDLGSFWQEATLTQAAKNWPTVPPSLVPFADRCIVFESPASFEIRAVYGRQYVSARIMVHRKVAGVLQWAGPADKARDQRLVEGCVRAVLSHGQGRIVLTDSVMASAGPASTQRARYSELTAWAKVRGYSLSSDSLAGIYQVSKGAKKATLALGATGCLLGDQKEFVQEVMPFRNDKAYVPAAIVKLVDDYLRG